MRNCAKTGFMYFAGTHSMDQSRLKLTDEHLNFHLGYTNTKNGRGMSGKRKGTTISEEERGNRGGFGRERGKSENQVVSVPLSNSFCRVLFHFIRH